MSEGRGWLSPGPGKALRARLGWQLGGSRGVGVSGEQAVSHHRWLGEGTLGTLTQARRNETGQTQVGEVRGNVSKR